MVEDLFGGLPASAQEQWRVNKWVRAGVGAANRAFDPPVVHLPDGFVQMGQTLLPVVRVVSDSGAARAALSEPDVGADAVITHGASFDRSNQFFGGQQTLHGGNVAAAGDPFLPRARTGPGGAPRITVMATLINLLDLLKYELLVASQPDYPPDGMRRAFDISGDLLRPASAQSQPVSDDAIRKYLNDLIDAQESGSPPPVPPPGWRLNRVAWDTVARYAFLEYHFFYAYNDFERYQTALFDNEHEGDDEGCCLVFERNALNVAATANDPDALLRVAPHSVITSVHEAFQDADILKFIPPPSPSAADPGRLARDDVTFTVYVAGGSHATYLTSGAHDLVDFGDTWGKVNEEAPILSLLLFPQVLAAAIILMIIEHFVDTEDFTSEDGVRTGPEGVVGAHPAAVANRLVVLPMSADNHIYGPGNEDLLGLRAYAGKWGGHEGIVDNSPPFIPKTVRYYRKLLAQL